MSRIEYNQGIIAFTGKFEGETDKRRPAVSAHERGNGILFFEGQKHPFTIVSPDIAPEIRYAVGRIDPNNFIVSEEVPEFLMREWLTHELLCLPVERETHCWEVEEAIHRQLEKEDPLLADTYALMRCQMFESLRATHLRPTNTAPSSIVDKVRYSLKQSTELLYR